MGLYLRQIHLYQFSQYLNQVLKTIYYYDIFILYCFYIQISLVAKSSLCALFICPHFVALDRHNF
jgi:hypothetical protein